MAVTLRSYGISTVTSAQTSCIVEKPAGLSVGDLMVAHVMARDRATNDIDITPPDEWSTIRQEKDSSTFGTGLFWKIADAADVAASDFTFTWAESASHKGIITAWTGHDPTSPINANEGQINAASTTVTSDGLTPSVADCVICFFCSITNDNTQSDYAIADDNPASWTEVYDYPCDISYDLGVSMAYATRPETSATGNATATTSGSNINIGMLIVIAPNPIIEKNSSDDGSGADAAELEAVLETAETGAGVESIESQTAALIATVETGSGADAIAALLSEIQDIETGSGVDFIDLIIAAIQGVETGTGADSANAPLADIAGVDNGAGIDAVVSFLASLVANDSGAGVDAAVLSAVFNLSENGTGLDEIVELIKGGGFTPRKTAFDGYRCFIEQYVKNKTLGGSPWKLPDGTKW
jgi:hypothetical protein